MRKVTYNQELVDNNIELSVEMLSKLKNSSTVFRELRTDKLSKLHKLFGFILTD